MSYAIHKRRAKVFFQFLRPPPPKKDGSEILDDTLILSYDCEKNLKLLKVPDSSAYYSRNVYFYNFTIVQGYSKSQLTPDNVTSFVWTENEFPKNANTIASCVAHHLRNIDLTFFKHIRLVADGCAGQNKNSIVVTALLEWFHKSAPDHILDIELVFPITGHSFIPPDRVFAQIELKTKKLDTIIDPSEYLKIIEQHSTVKRVGVDVKVWDYKRCMTDVMKPVAAWNFSISKIKRLLIEKTNSKKITLKGELFYEHDIGVPFSLYCKKGRSLNDLIFTEITKTNLISKEKKADLTNLIKKTFRRKLDVAIQIGVFRSSFEYIS